MRRIRVPGAALFVVALTAMIAVALTGRAVGAVADTLPERLSDKDFWQLSQDMSEPDGFFRSDNMLSNEIYYPEILPDLVRQVTPGRVYLGVGPEQNFNYIVALKPKMVFITDVRRGNLHTQLMYKALFEMSASRPDFYARLFSKPRPEGLSDTAPATEIVTKFQDVPTSGEDVYNRNLQAILDHLTKAPHQLPLSKDDLEGIAYVYKHFFWFGPAITYNASLSGGAGNRGNMTNYASLMVATSSEGAVQSYLASEATFKFMKDLETRNLLVPVVGNFAGPKALRAVGQYVRDHGSTVAAFYLSNVEQYLNQDRIWGAFCSNVATMPIDETSTFIRSGQGGFGFGGRGGGLRNSIGPMLAETRTGCGGG
jgi:hypothetical protein